MGGGSLGLRVCLMSPPWGFLLLGLTRDGGAVPCQIWRIQSEPGIGVVGGSFEGPGMTSSSAQNQQLPVTECE